MIFVLCLAAFPVIDYAGGRRCMPLAVPPFLPAEIVPFAIGLLAGGVLVLAVITSFIVRRHRLWTAAALAVAVIITWAFVSYGSRFPGFLEGLRDRFVTRVGYPKMRDFAKEFSLVDTEAIIRGPGRGNSISEERWTNLALRYPFLDWAYGTGTILVRDGIVELTWGSALTGHWGFQVSPAGAVKDLEEDEGAMLRVAQDIQFVYYFD